MRLNNKVAIVTGSSRGIGRAIALALAREGANIIVNCKDSIQLADDVVDLIKGSNQNALRIQADVTDRNQVEEMVAKTLDKFGRIDILINNAGTFNDSIVRKMEGETWDEVIATNLTGVFNCTRAVINFMREQKSGKIVNISSVQGQIGTFGASNYSASKAGVIGFTKSIAKEVARSGINVNAISLGFINTGMLKRLPQEMQDNILKQIPLGRFGEPEEVAQLVLFLVSDDSDYITGEVINMNGGFYM